MNTLSISFWKALFSVLLSSVSQQYRFYTTRMVLVCFMEGCVVVELGAVVDGRVGEEVGRCDGTVVVGGMAAGAR